MGNKQNKAMVAKSTVFDFYSPTICFLLQPRYVHDCFNDSEHPVPVKHRDTVFVQSEVQARFPSA